jgi:hypothetical protein
LDALARQFEIPLPAREVEMTNVALEMLARRRNSALWLC